MNDREYMERAIKLARLGEGKVNPNPLVGAVVVTNGKIVGEGWHQKYGAAHAEVNALEMAKEKARGGTLYVTLEPCSHYGKTPPCVKKIVDSGIKKCFVSVLDPNPLVSGNGIKYLKEAGIEIEVGLLADMAYEMNRVFFKYITKKIPYLFLKCGITLDGKIATRSGNSKWITNDIARERVQRLRTKYMGIMVGINTVLKDNPSLDSRCDNSRNPFRIVVDPNFDIDKSAKLLNFNDDKVILIVSEKNKETKMEKIREFEAKSIKFICLAGEEFKIEDILRELGKMNIDSVLLEGGSTLISNALKENVIDGGEIFVAPKILGDKEALSFVNGFEFENISDIIELPNPRFNIYGDNISVEFSR
ncbi:MAG: bifunctional diaminohydroxyphosphoribosylaminopyrimidine deaminase/5-amino-6-(5-phosphoribosylamino)uracil reductase RibD [Fusobacterium sp.]|uniref:bifunctional diaminohydroxyphosphoribosylaminopyrimidine deaminase/5-amino-6-(5-phosphoribosylamino)uracil reductase RibD n=1 Tax=Fusobacterium sp. TaxID=68766 RepID=UPI0026DD9068|nr:bifunctional diaminohydroxyphosphoribosylaminopyrimidine deaminase/5-amino-6-(5-phosphoribosylamino)uracil reductase RibD [Fusobacterium sp.]MDO4689925.1 bifunctional diaminohydroxyphosphoribosylaminopyrimidine deaminase/5-amino-6-(5-phosphoribosylamino)uracil reductase RibD [Fusobacterium sp.]